MKADLTMIFRNVLAVLIMAGCGLALDARADANAAVNAGIQGSFAVPVNGSTVDYFFGSVTQAVFSVTSSFRWEWYVNAAAFFRLQQTN